MNEKNIFNPECFYKVAKATSGSFIRCKNASLLTSFFNGIQGFKSGLVNVYLSRRQKFFWKIQTHTYLDSLAIRGRWESAPATHSLKMSVLCLIKLSFESCFKYLLYFYYKKTKTFLFYFSLLAILDLTWTSTVTISQIIQTYLKWKTSQSISGFLCPKIQKKAFL